MIMTGCAPICDRHGAKVLSTGRQQLLQSIEKRRLIGMDAFSRFIDRNEFRPVDFPRSARGKRVGRRETGKTMDALPAFAILNRPQRMQFARSDCGFFERLAAGGRFEVFARVGDPLGNAPRLSAVVIARRMDQQHLKSAAVPPVQQCACRFLDRRHTRIIAAAGPTPNPGAALDAQARRLCYEASARKAQKSSRRRPDRRLVKPHARSNYEPPPNWELTLVNVVLAFVPTA